VTSVTACAAGVRKLRFYQMKKIPIHWDDLESAFERNSPDTESFLDITGGHVVSLTVGDPEAPSLKAKVALHIANYVRVDPASSREQYRWMERFVGSVSESQLRERLVMAIDGKGAFRRFKDVLLAYPAERERWFTYRADLLHWHMHQWLSDHEIDPTTPAPWGEAKPPPDLGDVPPVPIPHGTEAPGEALRRQARELIDGLPAIELPSALAFLEFLGTRGQRAASSEGRFVERSATVTARGPYSQTGEMRPVGADAAGDDIDRLRDEDMDDIDDVDDIDDADDAADSAPVSKTARAHGVSMAASAKD
jgi:Uncharacterised protein family (UPF0158)